MIKIPPAPFTKGGVKIIILAAGKGARMKSDLPKALNPIKGEPMINYLIRSVKWSGVDERPIVVVSPDNKNLISRALKNFNCCYAVQKEQLGTGHAVSSARRLAAGAERIIVLYGDHPFLKKETINKMTASDKSVITLATVKIKDFKDWRNSFSHWGRIIRKSGEIAGIVEFKDATDKEKEIKELNPALYSFDAEWLWKNLKKLKNENAQGEYYLTDLIKLAFKEGKKIKSFEIDPREAIGINSKEELEVAEGLIK
jgi:bifunctional UDP-N-acetylglucosamine pyrophosphorylase/glucosamine-1-phosphate N-acetyltransferase